MFLNCVFILISTIWLNVLLKQCNGYTDKRNWDYEPLSIESMTMDPDKMNSEVRVERLGRGEFAMTGKFVFNYDLDETTMVEASAYRSATGSESDYKPLPWNIPKQTFNEFIASYYKDILYPNVKDCSNVPDPDKADPWPRDTYNLEKCVATGEGLPNILPEGYYKVHFNVTGEVDWNVVAIVKITTNNMMG